MPPDLQILIIGGGLSGLSAALHLARAGVEDLFVLEAERIGQGGNVYLPGTPGPVFPDYTKMVLTPDDRGYTYLSRRFNREVARNLLRVKRRGVELQLALAREFDPRLVRQYGTLIVGEPDDDRRLREEHRVMRDLGIDADIESYGAERIAALYGTALGKYVQGLFVAGDAIVALSAAIRNSPPRTIEISPPLSEGSEGGGRCNRKWQVKWSCPAPSRAPGTTGRVMSPRSSRTRRTWWLARSAGRRFIGCERPG